MLVAALLQVQQLPPELSDAQITYQQFADMARLRRNMHMLSFALDFCTQVSTETARQLLVNPVCVVRHHFGCCCAQDWTMWSPDVQPDVHAVG